jgi:hypothetical protein
VTHAATRAEWTRALSTVRNVVREPGALSDRSIALLRVGVVPQIEAALAMLAGDHAPKTLSRWNAFLPAAVAAVGPDPELTRAEQHLRSGLAALGV